MNRLPTASALARAAACPASEKLPHTGSTSEHAERGTAAHAFMARAAAVGRAAALAELEEDDPHRALCEAIPLAELPAGGDHEIAIAWNWVTDTARVLTAIGRNYADVGPTEFVGTYDYAGKEADGGGVLLDWKFGFRALGPARDSKQLRLGSLALSRLIGVDTVRAAYFFPREDGTYGVSWATFNAFDLAEIAEEMVALVSALEAAKPAEVNEGDHCTFCPAFNSCPAKINLALAIGSGEAGLMLSELEGELVTMDDVQLGTVYGVIDRFLDIADRVKAVIRARAEAQDIPAGDGQVLGVVQWPWTVVNATVALDVIAEKHGADVADRVVPRSATLAAVRKLGKETMEEIERRGGVITGKKPQVRLHRVKEAAK